MNKKTWIQSCLDSYVSHLVFLLCKDSVPDAPILTGIPRAPAGPEGPIGPCAPCEGRVRTTSGKDQDMKALHTCLGAQRPPEPGTTSRCSTRGKASMKHPLPPLNSVYSQTLLCLLVCQLGQQGQENLGAQELQEHPVHQSLRGHPVGARYQIQPRFQKEWGEFHYYSDWHVSTVPQPPSRDRHLSLTLTPAAPSLPGGPSAPGLPWTRDVRIYLDLLPVYSLTLI